MPKLELGDLEAVEKSKQVNIPVLAKLVDASFGTSWQSCHPAS